MFTKIKTKLSSRVSAKAVLKTFLIVIVLFTAPLAYYYFTDPYQIETATVEHKEKLKEYSSIKVYIIEQAEKHKLDPMDIFAILFCESRLNENAINVNSNGTVDLGIVQANSIHLRSGSITLKCASDARCSIDWMIQKRLHDGNWSAWVCANKLDIK